MKDSWLEETKDGVLLRLQIQPNASRTEVIGLHGEPPRLKIRIASPPVEGAANEELLHFLRKKLKVKSSQLTILRGQTSKMKDVLCEGISVSVVLDIFLPSATFSR